MKKHAGGDILRGIVNQRGSTQGRSAQSVVSAKGTRNRRPPRVKVATYILPSEVREGWKVMHMTKDGKHITRVDY